MKVSVLTAYNFPSKEPRPRDTKVTLKDQELNRQVIRLIMFYGFSFGVLFSNIEPGVYEAKFRCRLANERLFVKHTTRVGLTWKDGFCPQSSASSSSDEECLPPLPPREKTKSTELVLVSEDWEKLYDKHKESWFDVQLDNVNISNKTNVEFKLHNETEYCAESQCSVIFLDYMELKEASPK